MILWYGGGFEWVDTCVCTTVLNDTYSRRYGSERKRMIYHERTFFMRARGVLRRHAKEVSKACETTFLLL